MSVAREARWHDCAIVAALGVGAILGAAATGSLRAQGPPTAYAVIEISEFTDPESFKAVLANTPMGLVPFGGRFVIRSDNVVPLDGVPPKRFVLTRWTERNAGVRRRR